MDDLWMFTCKVQIPYFILVSQLPKIRESWLLVEDKLRFSPVAHDRPCSLGAICTVYVDVHDGRLDKLISSCIPRWSYWNFHPVPAMSCANQNLKSIIQCPPREMLKNMRKTFQILFRAKNKLFYREDGTHSLPEISGKWLGIRRCPFESL